MQVTLFMVISANGMTARPNGDEDFLSELHWDEFCKCLKQYGNLIWGRKTYESVKGWGGDYLKRLGNIQGIVVTRKKNFHPGKGWLVASSPRTALALLEKKGFKKALLSGGATLNAAFARARLIDRIRIDIEPAVIGKGIGLFTPAAFECRLKLTSCKRLKKGILSLDYTVV